MSIRVLVADDDNLFREGLCLLIEKERDMEVVGRTAQIETLPKLIRTFAPDVLVLATDMERGRGHTLGRQVHNVSPSLPVLGVTSKPTPDDAKVTTEFGFTDCLDKASTLEELRGTIRRLGAKRASDRQRNE